MLLTTTLGDNWEHLQTRGYCLVMKLSITTGKFSHWIILDSVINDRRSNQN